MRQMSLRPTNTFAAKCDYRTAQSLGRPPVFGRATGVGPTIKSVLRLSSTLEPEKHGYPNLQPDLHSHNDLSPALVWRRGKCCNLILPHNDFGYNPIYCDSNSNLFPRSLASVLTVRHRISHSKHSCTHTSVTCICLRGCIHAAMHTRTCCCRDCWSL